MPFAISFPKGEISRYIPLLVPFDTPQMTHSIAYEDVPSVRQVLLYIVSSVIIGFLFSFFGALVSAMYPNMTADTRTLLALVMIYMSSMCILWSAGLLRIGWFIAESFAWILIKRDSKGVLQL